MFELQNQDYFDRTAETKKAGKRLTNLVNRLTPEAKGIPVGTPKGEGFFVEKVFDPVLKSCMEGSYNVVAMTIGDDMIAVLSDNCTGIEDSFKDRKGFAFVEYATLVCLFGAIRGRSIEALNRPIVTENEKKRARARFRKIRDVLYSKTFEYSMMSALFDLMGSKESV